MKGLVASSQDIPVPQKVPMRLNPSTGRSVTISSTLDLSRGLRLLEQNCARNKVRSDFTRQRFHERPGLKRKRLRRERWRRRFMLGFKAAVSRVKELKNQGW
jgi:small subunit ribosomal protein MRP21